MRSRRLRTTVYGLLAVALLAVVVLLGGGWFYAGEIKNGALAVDYDDSPLDMEVVAVGDGRVTLRATPEADKDGDWRSPGTWGLQREEGYDQVGAILELTDRQVVREYIPLTGGLRVGTAVRVDSNAFPGDPLEAHGLAFEDVSFSSPLGEFPAWQVTADTSTWAIFVHGRNSKRGTRRGALRMLPAVAESGITSLIINYRNDEGLPPNPDGYHRFGQTEWADLEGAAEYAVDSGAEKLILVGHSMGGAIVASFLYQSPVAESVVGVVLNAPMLDFDATVDYGASRRSVPVVGLPIPGVLTAMAKSLAGFRFGIDFEALDYLSRADQLAAPVLLFHGDADKTVPVTTSDALARARPDIVEYIRGADVGHTRSWNSDPAAYEEAVTNFLRGLTE